MFQTKEDRAQAVAEINRQIGIRLAALTASQAKGPADIAAALGVSVTRVTRIENGHSDISAAELVLAARALGVTSAILTGEERFALIEGSAK